MSSLFGFEKLNLSQEEFRQQVASYYTLKFLQTSRGILVALIIFSLLVTILFGHWLLSLSLGAIMLAVLIYSTLACFIYQGYKWAVVIFMIVLTIDKAVQLVSSFTKGTNGSDIVIIGFWWFFYIKIAYEAYRVEKERRRLALQKV